LDATRLGPHAFPGDGLLAAGDAPHPGKLLDIARLVLLGGLVRVASTESA